MFLYDDYIGRFGNDFGATITDWGRKVGGNVRLNFASKNMNFFIML